VGVRFGQRLRHWRHAADLTPDDVAAQCGIKQALLSHLETGRRDPSDDVLRRLATVLSVDYWDLKKATYDDVFSEEEIPALRAWLAARDQPIGSAVAATDWAELEGHEFEYRVERLLQELGLDLIPVPPRQRKFVDMLCLWQGHKVLVECKTAQRLSQEMIDQAVDLGERVAADAVVIVKNSPVSPSLVAAASRKGVAVLDVQELLSARNAPTGVASLLQHRIPTLQGAEQSVTD
jgi:transcriptional regulator with XRE-family HTH domain